MIFLKDKKLLKFQIFAIIFSIVLGTLLHFTYEWSGQNCIVAIFSSVNESTWEHLKLAFYPMLIILIIGYFYMGKKYIFPQTIGILTTIAFITVFFYTYTGVIGKNIDILNISTFIIGIIIGEIVTYLVFKNIEKNSIDLLNKIAIAIILALLFGFIIFTFNPPKINLFLDPVTNIYGINCL